MASSPIDSRTSARTMDYTHPPVVAMEALSLTAIVGTLTSVLPPLAALFAIVWHAILIWDSTPGRRVRERVRVAVRDTETKVLLLWLTLSGAGMSMLLYGINRVLQ